MLKGTMKIEKEAFETLEAVAKNGSLFQAYYYWQKDDQDPYSLDDLFDDIWEHSEMALGEILTLYLKGEFEFIPTDSKQYAVILQGVNTVYNYTFMNQTGDIIKTDYPDIVEYMSWEQAHNLPEWTHQFITPKEEILNL